MRQPAPTDLEQLREYAAHYAGLAGTVMQEAADEIRVLRQQVRWLKDMMEELE